MKKMLLWAALIAGALLSLFCASNYFAHAAAAASLGSPQWGPLYSPFKILQWRVQLWGSYNRQFGAALWIGLIVFAAILAVSLFLYSRFKTKVLGLYGNSRWLKERELKFQGMLKQNFDSIVFGQNAHAKFQQKSAEAYEEARPGKIIFNNESGHIYVNGPTRSGKGISIIIPTLLSYTESVFVYDIKKENFEKTSGWRKKFSHVVKLEFANPESAHFNVMSYVKKGDTEIRDLQNIIGNLSNPDGKQQDYDYWVESAKNLLLACMLHLLYCQGDPGAPPFSLAGVRAFMLAQEKEEIVKAMLEKKHIKNGISGELETHPEVIKICVEMQNKSDKELAGVFGTATSYLGLFADPIVAKNTNDSDFELQDMYNGEHPISLYLVVSPTDQVRMKPLVRMLIQSLSDSVMENVKKKKHPILCLIDEFNSLGKMPFFETNIAYYMGYGMRCMVVCQGFNQLFGTYGRETSILDNCRFKLILGVSTPDDAKVVSDYIGTTSIAKSSVSKSGQVGTFIAGGRSESISESEQKLMTPEEVLHLPYEDWLLLTNGRYPYRGKKLMYYLDERYKPRVLEEEAPDTRLQQIAEMPRPVIAQGEADLLPAIPAAIDTAGATPQPAQEEPEQEPISQAIDEAEEAEYEIVGIVDEDMEFEDEGDDILL